jgi:hypothetical protein
MIESLKLRLAVRGSERKLAFLGDAVAAASARCVGAIGEKLLTFVQLNFLVGPKHFAAHAIGNIDGEIAVESHHASLGDVEIGVVRGDNGIIASGGGEFLRVLGASGNYGVWIKAALRGKTVGQRDSDRAGVQISEARIRRDERRSEMVATRCESRRNQREHDQNVRERSDSPEVEAV